MSQVTKSGVKTTETSLEIIDLLVERNGARIEEIVDELELTSSTVHRHLSTLHAHGYVTKTGGVYNAGFLFLTIAGQMRRQLPAYRTIKEKVDYLADRTGERAQFIIGEGTERVYVYTESGDNAVQTGASTGGRGPIHSSAAGKSILANLQPYQRKQIIASLPMEKTGPNTITDRDELRNELAAIRERGYAFNREESSAGVHAIGAVTKRNESEVVGALSVSGPATRLKGEDLENELTELILAATNELELQIKHS